MNKFLAAVLFSVFWLVSCSAPGNGTAVNSNSVSENKTSAAAPPSSPRNESAAKSNRLDACRVLPKAEAERILGRTVKSAELSRVAEGTEATAAFSQCTYQTTGGQIVEFFARRSPAPDNTPGAIEKLRDAMKSLGKMEDVGGVGETAFWISGINQLHVFEGEKIYLYLTMRNFKSADEARAKSVELARSAAGALSGK